MENETDICVPANCEASSESQISLMELTKAVKMLKNSRTPGSDGLPAEFYKMFWNKLGPIYHQTILSSFSKGFLHESSRRGILNLIPKPNKDSRLLKNLRPITLLNVDYKILEKAISNRLQSALDNIINHDQKGFMPDRRISANIHKVFDIIKATEEQDFSGLILSVDWSKAFDRVET